MGQLLNGSFTLCKAILIDKEYCEKKKEEDSTHSLCVVKVVKEKEE